MVSTSIMAALVVAALFWGNCLSCPQMRSAAMQDPHSCCHHTQPVKVDCQSQALQHFVKAPATEAPAPAIEGDRIATVFTPVMEAWSDSLAKSAEPPPPDLLLLHSFLRI